MKRSRQPTAAGQPESDQAEAQQRGRAPDGPEAPGGLPFGDKPPSPDQAPHPAQRASSEGPAYPDHRPSPASASAAFSAETSRATLLEARYLLRQLDPAPPATELASRLPSGWTQNVGDLDARLGSLLEWLTALSPAARRGALPTEALQPSPERVLSILHLAEAIRPYDLASACSLAETAMVLAGQLAAEERDCRFLFDQLAGFWAGAAEEELVADRTGEAETCIDIARILAQAGGGEPATAARLGVARAQLHWQRVEIPACLTELDAALQFCEQAEDPGLLGATLYLKGLTLQVTGETKRARECLERCLELLPGTHRDTIIDLATAALQDLDEQL